MSEISILAINLAKNSFQVCGVRSDGGVVFNRAVSRGRLAQLLADQQRCVVAMEACATSHHWGRVAEAHGHEVRLISAKYVKPFVKRQKNDFPNAAAIAEAASRPSKSFVAVKSW
jgi:transposase